MARPAHPARRPAAAEALLAAALTLSACGDDAVSPLPVRAPTPTTAAASAAGPSAPATTAAPGSTAPPDVDPTVRRPPPAAPSPTRSSARPTRTPSPSAPPSACLGAVRYDLVLAETELALVRSLCFAPGGVLRIVGIGPGEITVDRPELVSRNYEAGVQDLRFLRAGTVEVTIPYDGRAYVVAVVVT
ncbi:hypothetical protein ACIBTV_19300 [Micromonospora sp. NPDC049366]|uniref:hypothetical protein n=1 Tax=Micromonospora sp. NPDC049366 TaxID=3364271 RepID=UPI00379664B2